MATKREEGMVLTMYQSGKKRGGGRIQTVNTILKVEAAGFQPHIQQQGF
jgi:hypothetical protein